MIARRCVCGFEYSGTTEAATEAAHKDHRAIMQERFEIVLAIAEGQLDAVPEFEVGACAWWGLPGGGAINGAEGVTVLRGWLAKGLG